MDIEVRDYQVDFFKAYSIDDDTPRQLMRFLQNVIAAGRSPEYKHGIYPLELRDLGETRRAIHGVVGKFRNRQLPHAAAPGEAERELDLADDEGLLEKNHFVYIKQGGYLIYQRNHYGVGASALSGLVTEALGETVIFVPLIEPDAMRRLIQDGALRTRKFEVSVAKPGEALLQDMADNGRNWDGALMRALRDTGASKIDVCLSADGRATDRRRFLNDAIFAPLQRLLDNTPVKKARVYTEAQDGEVDRIDLLSDRISDTIQVHSDGKYPNSEVMWQELQHAWNRQRALILEVAGDGAADTP